MRLAIVMSALVAVLALSMRAEAEEPLCDAEVAPGSSPWHARWGTWAAATLEPRFHARCPATTSSARVTTGDINAVALEWTAPVAPSAVRHAEISFLVPSFAEWSHIALFAAYDATTIGRVGADIFHETRGDGTARDRLTIQFNLTADEECAGENLFAPVPIAGGITPGHWYRLAARVTRRSDGGLTVAGSVRDLDLGNSVVATTSFRAPASCTPSWFPADAEWGAGVLASRAGIDTYLDDFVGVTAPATPPTVTFATAFEDPALASELAIDADAGFAASPPAGELAVAGADGALGEIRIATAFRALGDFTAAADVRRDLLGADGSLGLRAVTAAGRVEVFLLGADVIAAAAGGDPPVRVDDASATATLRLTRSAGAISAAADTGAGLVTLATFDAEGLAAAAHIELFLRSATADGAPAIAGAFDDLTVTASQLATADLDDLSLSIYRTTWDVSVSRFVRFGPVDLTDVLGLGTYDVLAPRTLAVARTDTPVAEASPALLLEYPLTVAAGAPAFSGRTLRVVGDCSAVDVQLRRAVSVLVPSTATLDGVPGFPDASALDHFVCYQASRVGTAGGAVPPKGTQVEVADPVQTRRYDLGRITKLCNPVDKQGDPILRSGPRHGTPKPIDPAVLRARERNLVCHQAKIARRTIAQGSCGPLRAADRGTAIVPAQAVTARRAVAATTQLGTAPLETLREAEVCLPASVLIPAL